MPNLAGINNLTSAGLALECARRAVCVRGAPSDATEFRLNSTWLAPGGPLSAARRELLRQTSSSSSLVLLRVLGVFSCKCHVISRETERAGLNLSGGRSSGSSRQARQLQASPWAGPSSATNNASPSGLFISVCLEAAAAARFVVSRASRRGVLMLLVVVVFYFFFFVACRLSFGAASSLESEMNFLP